MRSSSPKILGLFPSIAAEQLGGIEASGRVAWQAVSYRWRDSALLMYAPGTRSSENEWGAFLVRSKRDAVRTVISQRWRPDIVVVWHLHLLKLIPFLWRSRFRTVVVLHGIEAWKPMDWLTRRLLRRVELVLSASEFTWKTTLSCNPGLCNTRHLTVPLGIGEPVASVITPPSKKPAVLMLGRMMQSEDYKGHREMIQIWPHVLERFPGAELRIAGTGDLVPDLEKLAALNGIERHVHFLGRISEEEKQLELAACRCLALPSRKEGFGLVYLEAIRMGRPCLISTVDAGQETIPPEAGLAADPGNAMQLTDAVCRLLTPGLEWERWSKSARQLYEMRFTAARFQHRFLAALEQCS